jgi:hypothetical protein
LGYPKQIVNNNKNKESQLDYPNQKVNNNNINNINKFNLYKRLGYISLNYLNKVINNIKEYKNIISNNIINK